MKLRSKMGEDGKDGGTRGRARARGRVVYQWCHAVVAMVVPGFGALAVAGDTAEKYCSWDQEQVIISNKLLGSNYMSHISYHMSTCITCTHGHGIQQVTSHPNMDLWPKGDSGP